jgi:8-amino-7-oxononanoate synthase
VHKSTFEEHLQQKLNDRISNSLYRSLIVAHNKIDFCSNDYLGFAKKFAESNFSYSNAGATGSRLISGNSAQAELAEQCVAKYHQTEAALIFNSGYAANVGLFSCIAGKDDVFIYDEYIHASVHDGMRLSLANKHKFKHNDVADLENKLRLNNAQNKFVAIESIYSMDGDEAPLIEIVEVCKKYNALLIVDEAHAIGIIGNKGEGLVAANKLQDDVFAAVYTFGKALGLHGAAVAGSNVLKNYLINFSRSFIYSTALPPIAYSHIAKAYSMLLKANRETLFFNIHYFKQALKSLPHLKSLPSNSAIQSIIIGDNKKAKSLSENLFNNGLFAKAILSPTVPVGTERIRVCIHSFNTTNEIDLLINLLKQYS